jgi:PKD repeat protein
MQISFNYLKWLWCIVFITVQCSILSANPNGAPTSGVHPVDVTMACPSFTGPSVSCVNQLETYLTTPVAGVSYTWAVSAGGVLSNTTGPSTLVNWTAAGPRFVVLTSTGPGAAVTTCTLAVNVSVQPTPTILTDFISDCPEDRKEGNNAAGASQGKKECWVVCENSTVNYSTTNVAGNTYQWVIVGGSPSTATGSSVSVTWGPSGTGSVTLTETAPGGCSVTVEECIKIVDSPIAKFLFNGQDPSSPLKICLGQTVYFSDLSTGGAFWLWEFGDGGTSTLQNPDHTYNNPGTYVGTLTVKNECGCTSVLDFKVIVSDQVSPEIGCISTVCLNDCAFYSVGNLSNCPGANISWSIYGGKILNNPTTGSVNVIWDDNDGYIQANGHGLICVKVSGCPDLCDGEVCVRVPVIHQVSILGDLVACVGDPVTYYVPVQPGINEGFAPDGVDFDWVVSAGGTIISTPPYSNSITVIWNTPGTGWVDLLAYENTLTAGGGCKFDPDKIGITIKPSFDIFPDNATICLGNSQVFNLSGTGSFNWTMTGPGGTVGPTAGGASFTATPTVPGTYVISASSTSGVYCNVTPSAVLQVLPNPAIPTGTLSGTLSVCPNTPYSYTLNTAPAPGTVLIWSITGGTLYGAAGQTVTAQWSGIGPMTLSVQAMGTQAPFCTSPARNFTITNYVPPTTFVQGTSTACVNETRPFNISAALTNYTNLQWSVSPLIGGSVTSGQGTPNIAVLFNTSAPPTVYIVCTATVCGALVKDSIAVAVTQIPTYTIVANPSPACQNAPVALSLASSAGVSTYSWDFGDATPLSNLPNPSHAWASSGSFPITAQLTLNICGNPTVNAATTINILPLPVINVTSSNGYVLCGAVTSTNLTATTQFTSTYLWSTGQNTPVINVTLPGVYTVTATNPQGCTSSSSVIVLGCGNCIGCTSTTLPWTFTYVENCASFTFTPVIPGTSNATFHSWDFGDGTPLNTVAGTSPITHPYAHPGYYQVRLRSIDSLGCLMTYVQTIAVKFKGGFSYTFNCPSGSGTLQTVLTDRSEYLPQPVGTFSAPTWYESGVGIIGTGSVLNASLSPGPHTVYLQVSYPGQTCVSQSQVIIVPAFPVAAFTHNAPKCEGVPVVFNNTSTGGGITGYSWNFGDMATSGVASPQRTYDAPPNTFTVTLTVSNNWGCSSSATAILPIASRSNTNPTITMAPPSPQCQGTPINLTTGLPIGFPTPVTYGWFNTVAPATPLGTSVGYTPSISGSYGVNVSDGNGCIYNVLAPSPVIYLPPPVVQIVGKTDYCLGEQINISANLGSLGYTYSWTVTPPSGPSSSFSGANVSMPANAAGTYTFAVTIVHTASGCSNSGSMNVVVHAGVSGLTITSSANCEPATLTANGVGAVFYNWSTGDNTASTIVNQGGFYSVIASDNWGCTAKATYFLEGKPDLSNIMTGCYEYCEPVIWQAIACAGCTYQWYLNGSAIAGEINSTINITTSGTYTVEVSNGPGCTSQSDPIDISIASNPDLCEKCAVDTKDAIFNCVGYDPITGNLIYEFTINVVNYGGALYGLSAISSFGPVTIDNPSSGYIPGGGAVTPVHGYLIWDGQNRDGCFKFQGYLTLDCESTELCEFRWCGELPKCCDKPCSLKLREANVECIGFGYYKVTFSLENTGCALTNGFIKGAYGIYNITPTNIPVGITTFTAIVFGTPGANGFAVCGYQFNGERCCIEFRLEFGDCRDTDCKLEAGRNNVTCIGQNAAGNSIFQFTVEVYGAPAGASFVVIPTYGFITNLSWICSGNVCTLTGIYEQIGGNDTDCFEVLAIGSGTEPKICLGKGCVEIPRCEGNKPSGERTEKEANDVITAETTDSFYLVPNPATDMVTISMFNPLSGVTGVRVTDMVGQLKISKYPKDNDLNLDISRLPAGIYNVTVTDSNGVNASKKLIIINSK